MQGVLYIVATPIGNMGDLSLRAIDTLRQVDLICAEDTRVSRKLLSHYQIKTPIMSLHEYNETGQAKSLVNKLQAGKNIALISDAGTPLISDPGFRLVKAVRGANIKVIPVPGACAAIAALSASGLPTDSFMFIGFLPTKNAARKKQLEQLSDGSRTMIFYEAPRRVLNTLNDMLNVFGENKEAVLAKELTKIYETIYAGNIREIIDWLEEDVARQKGEFVILLKGKEREVKQEVDAYAQKVLKILMAELPNKTAVKMAAKITGLPKNVLYAFYLRSACGDCPPDMAAV